MKTRNQKSHGFTLIEILIVVALIGIIFGFLIPNLVDGLNKAIQKRTIADMHAVSIAMISYHTDMHGAAAAGSSVQLTDYDPIALEGITDLLTPLYIDHVPNTDPWGNPYDYYFGRTTEEYGYELAFGIRSRGRDGIADDNAYAWGAFNPILYDWDIVWLDGLYVTWPAHQGEKTGGGGCNQGIGNGVEGCDPGNSNNNQESNDEGDGNRGGGNGNGNGNGGGG